MSDNSEVSGRKNQNNELNDGKKLRGTAESVIILCGTSYKRPLSCCT